MDFLAGLFALAVVVSLFGGIIGLIWPSLFRFGRKERPNRKQILTLALVGFVVSLGGFGATVPEPTAALAAQKKAEQAAKTSKMRTQREEIINLWTAISDAGRDCAAEGQTVEKLVEANNRYDAYAGAKAAERACGEADWKMVSLAAPDELAEPIAEEMTKAIRLCRDSYLGKKLGYSPMARVFDGDERPSTVNEARARMSAADTAMMACVASFMGAAAKAGIKPADIAAAS